MNTFISIIAILSAYINNPQQADYEYRNREVAFIAQVIDANVDMNGNAYIATGTRDFIVKCTFRDDPNYQFSKGEMIRMKGIVRKVVINKPKSLMFIDNCELVNNYDQRQNQDQRKRIIPFWKRK